MGQGKEGKGRKRRGLGRVKPVTRWHSSSPSLVSDVVEKHRLVVGVESLASSWKKLRRGGVGVVVEKMKKVDDLSTKIRVIYLQQ